MRQKIGQLNLKNTLSPELKSGWRFNRSCEGRSVLGFKSLLIFLGLVWPGSVGAKMHIEPYAGWSFIYTNSRPFTGNILDRPADSINYVTEGRYYHGLTSGMRLGYSSLGFAVGVDMTFGYWKFLYGKSPSAHSQETALLFLPGLFASYKLPLLFRIYAVATPHAYLYFRDQKSDSFDKSCKSSGAKLGLSYLSLPFFSVNFEYIPMYIWGSNCGSWAHIGTVYANFTF